MSSSFFSSFLNNGAERREQSYYQVLEVSSSASSEQIKKSYKALALIYHTDRNPEGGEKFKVISRAHKVLVDPELRRLYDAGGEAAVKRGESQQQNRYNDDNNSGGGTGSSWRNWWTQGGTNWSNDDNHFQPQPPFQNQIPAISTVLNQLRMGKTFEWMRIVVELVVKANNGNGTATAAALADDQCRTVNQMLAAIDASCADQCVQFVADALASAVRVGDGKGRMRCVRCERPLFNNAGGTETAELLDLLCYCEKAKQRCHCRNNCCAAVVVV